MEIPDDIAQMFFHHDGSLPGIVLTDLTEKQIKEIYEGIQDSFVSPPDDVTFWSMSQKKDLPINAVLKPADMIISGETESFAHRLKDLQLNDQILNDLSILVMPEQIEFFWGGAADWNLQRIEAFLSYLKSIVTADMKVEFSEENSFADSIYAPDNDYYDQFMQLIK